MSLLQVNNLEVIFQLEDHVVAQVVDDLSFSLEKGESLGIVGESGCGKSVTALSIMRLLPLPMSKISKGSIIFKGQDLLQLAHQEMRKIRGNKIAMIFQEPMTALNPLQMIGRQIEEVFYLHAPGMSADQIYKKSLELLDNVGIPEVERRFYQYPHQLSGGLRQRVMIAMALACKPDILIADEPTTALDVTIQAQILDLIKEMQKDLGMSLIFITHDLGVIYELCSKVLVMYAGREVESAPVDLLFKNPSHPYTQGLLASIPLLTSTPKEELATIAGSVPHILDFPSYCRFYNRCSAKQDICLQRPQRYKLADDHYFYCPVRAQELSKDS